MRFNRFRFTIAGLALAGLITATAPAHSEKILKAAAGNPGAASHAIMTIFAKIANRETGTSIQINNGQTLTKTTLALGLGKLDLTPSVPAIIQYLGQGTRMYRKVKSRAQKASGGVRGIMGWMANWFHPVVFEDRPIKKWADIKGKRVFTGPPSGAAAVTGAIYFTGAFSVLVGGLYCKKASSTGAVLALGGDLAAEGLVAGEPFDVEVGGEIGRQLFGQRPQRGEVRQGRPARFGFQADDPDAERLIRHCYVPLVQNE